MFKVISKAVVVAGIVVLAGCGSLPEKSKVEANTGILAIAKAYTSEVSESPGWAPEVKIRKYGSGDVEKIVQLRPINGKQFQFIDNLPEGYYSMGQIRYVTTEQNIAIGNNSPWKTLGITFRVSPGKVTVLKKILIAKTSSIGGGDRFRTNWDFIDWFPEAKDEYTILMNKYNKKGEWEVIDHNEKKFVK